MSQAIAGHGALIAMEKDPVGSPGVFTTIAELNSDIKWPELSRPEVEVSTHQDNIDQWITSGTLTRGSLTFSVNFLFNDSTHDHLTGLTYAIRQNQMRGFRLRGPSSTAGPSVDEWIMSGFVQKIDETAAIKGARTANITVRPTKAMIIDGVTLS